MDQIIIVARNIYGVVVQDGCRAKGFVTPQYTVITGITRRDGASR